MKTERIRLTCHCGAVKLALPAPEAVTDCNCSICRRLATLWAYGNEESIDIEGVENTFGYVQGDKCLAMHTCRTCGCTTHWISLEGERPRRIAVNMRLAETADLEGVHIKKFDGADTWTYLN